MTLHRQKKYDIFSKTTESRLLRSLDYSALNYVYLDYYFYYLSLDYKESRLLSGVQKMIWIVVLFVGFVVTSVADQQQTQPNVAYEQQEEISDELFGEVLREVERQNNWEPEQ